MKLLGAPSVPVLASRLRWNESGWSDNELSKYRAGTNSPSYDKLMAILWHSGLLRLDDDDREGDAQPATQTALQTAYREALQLAQELRDELRAEREERQEAQRLLTQIVRGLENLGVEIPREVSSRGGV
jgi:hypothetical protein